MQETKAEKEPLIETGQPVMDIATDYRGLDTPDTVTANTNPSESNDYRTKEELALSVVDAQSRKYWGIACIVGGVCLEMFIGCFFLWGNISVYVLSYYHEKNANLSYGFVFYVDTILVGFNCLGY